MKSCHAVVKRRCFGVRPGGVGLTLLVLALSGCQGSCDGVSPRVERGASSADAGARVESPPEPRGEVERPAVDGGAPAAGAGQGAVNAQAREAALEKKRRARTQAHLARLADVIEAVSKESGQAPSSLYDLVEPPRGEPVLAQPDLRDPWGNDVLYTLHEGGRFELRSVGPDNAWGGADDMVLSRP